MAPLLILLVGLMRLANVESAPVANTRIDRFTVPALDNRFNLDDKRQNWGILINGSSFTEPESANYNYRPITIPRLSKSQVLAPEEKVEVETALINDPIPEIGVTSKAKRFLENKPEINGVKEMKTNEETKKTSSECDLIRIKCCMNKWDLKSCPISSECLLDNPSDLCDRKVLLESIRRAYIIMS